MPGNGKMPPYWTSPLVTVQCFMNVGGYTYYNQFDCHHQAWAGSLQCLDMSQSLTWEEEKEIYWMFANYSHRSNWKNWTPQLYKLHKYSMCWNSCANIWHMCLCGLNTWCGPSQTGNLLYNEMGGALCGATVPEGLTDGKYIACVYFCVLNISCFCICSFVYLYIFCMNSLLCSI